MGWGNLLAKGASVGGKILGETGKAAFGIVKGAAVAHPVLTAGGVVVAMEAAKARNNGESTIHQLVSDVGSDSIADIVDNGIERRALRSEQKTEQVRDSINGAPQQAPAASDGLSQSASELWGAITAGGQPVASFLEGIRNGRIGALSVIGLVASAVLLFGRHGVLGKIAGFLLGLNVIRDIADSAAPRSAISAEQLRQNFSDRMEESESMNQSRGLGK